MCLYCIKASSEVQFTIGSECLVENMGFINFEKYFLPLTIIILILCSVQIQSDRLEDCDNLLALFDSPLLSLDHPKLNRYFEVPESYKDRKTRVKAYTGPKKDLKLHVVKVENISTLPNLEEITSISRTGHFSLFTKKHIDIAAKLINILLAAEDLKKLISLLCYVHDKINPYLYIYALSATLMNREDTKGLRFPNHVQVLPDKYVNKEVLFKIKEQVESKSPENWEIIDVPVEQTASDLEVEHKLAYWREDIALNVHHWHWHLTYPNGGNIILVNKDRRGESFYYMHQQVIARYNFERFCSYMNRVERFSNWFAPIREAYFPKLDTLVANEVYASRPRNMVLDDIEITSENIEVDIADMIRYRDRIYKAIDLGYVETPNGTEIRLNSVNGIDMLANMVESSILSPNYRYYGDLHDDGHLTIAYIHDPKHYHLVSAGVMAYVETAMRDPMFYRWHAFVNKIFNDFKETLPAYTAAELQFPDVSVTDVNVTTHGEKHNNVFRTFWSTSIVNLTHGVDFRASNSIIVRYTHLQHQNFTYSIAVRNRNFVNKRGTCRIFMAPLNDETKAPWSRFVDQRQMFIELDRFDVTLKANATTTITRNSTDSTVSIPFERTFYNFDRPRSSLNESEIFNYGGCGWPHHMLIPKGTEEGFPVQLFVMVSDYEQDQVVGASENGPGGAYCGIRGSKYPDRKAMGFPFDRLPRRNVRNLAQFLTSNMFVRNCTIKHKNKVI